MALVQPTLHFRPRLALPLAFLLSACSLAYQQLLVYGIADISGDFVLSQSLGLGAFLLGMGLGTWSLGTPETVTPLRLIKVEMALAVTGLFSVSILYGGEILLQYFLPALSGEQKAFCFLPLPCLVGYLTGQEIPLLVRLSPLAGRSRILAYSYFGAVLAMIAMPLVLLPVFDLWKAAFLTAITNFCLSSFMIWRYSAGNGALVAALVFAAGLVPWLRFEPHWRDLHLKFIYFPSSYTSMAAIGRDLRRYDEIDPPVRIRSAYQWIDVFPGGANGLPGSRNDFLLFLDRKFQVSGVTQRRYHEAMASGGMYLLGAAPEKVLILGGGDGLLLPFLLKNQNIKSVDLIELDPKVLELARDNRELAKLNENSLSDPRVKIHVNDAFKFVRESKEKYDLVLIDFPLPATYELSLLYTREFYALVHARMSARGIMLMDFALPDDLNESLPVLLRTLNAAGFSRPMGFGQEDLFIASAADGRRLAFDFADVNVSNQTLLTLASRNKAMEHARNAEGKINSIFFPHRFRFAYAGEREENVEYADNPGLMALLMDHYSKFHNRKFFDQFKRWPAPLLRALLEDWKTPRDFRQVAGGEWMWPRFQWEYAFGDDQRLSVFHWFDFEQPEKLRAPFVKFARVSDGDWCGISYDVLTAKYVTYSRTAASRPGFEGWALKGSDGTMTYFSQDRQTSETWLGKGLVHRRYFSVRNLSAAPDSKQERVIEIIVNEFLQMPSSYILDKDAQIRSLFYP